MAYLWYNPLGFANTGCFIEFPEAAVAEVDDAIADLDCPHVFVWRGKSPNSLDVVPWGDRGRLDGYWYSRQYGVPS